MRTVRVTQNADSEVSFVAAPQANLRYVYIRSSDSVANQIEGQDYLVFKYNDKRLAFVVCDGVGSSFCGNIAARVLGEGLLEWLWSAEADYLTGPEALSEAARAFLRNLQPQAQQEVEAYQIPDHLPALVQQALNQQRSYGSEAVFVGGRLDHPTEDLPDGRLMLVWMGDTQARLFDDGGGEIDIKANWTANDRWSSVVGVKGTVHAWLGGVNDIARLLVFSDGMMAHADNLATYADIELEEAIEAQFRTAISDDVALLDIVRHTRVYLGLPEDGSSNSAKNMAPILAPVDNGKRENSYQMKWEWQGGKAKFELQEATNPAFNDAYLEQVGSATTWQTEEPRLPGRYYYRVRAIVGRKNVPGPWSELQTARVAHPPPQAPQIDPVDPTAAQGAYTVVWNEVDNAQDYVLEEATHEDLSDATPVYRGRGTSWNSGTGHQPMTYYYRVQATSDGGASSWSEAQAVAVIVPPPPVPSLAFIAQVPADSPYLLSWSDVAQATHYEVQEIDEASAEESLFRTADTRMPMDVRATGNYTYRVRACHQYGCSEWSNPQTAEVLPGPPTETPQIIADGPDSGHMLLLKWTSVAEASDYMLEEADKANFKRSMPYSLGSRTQHSLLRREPGLYYYRVRGHNAAAAGPWSQPVEVQVKPGNSAWLDVSLPDDDSPQIEVAWDVVAGHVSYQLELLTGDIDPDSGEWMRSKAVYNGSEPLCIVRLPKEARTLRFRVRATHPSGDGEWHYGEPVERFPQPPAPDLHEPDFDEKGNILIKWTPVDGAIHYQVERARDESFTAADIHQHQDSQFVFKPPGGGRYWFRVSACNEHGCGEASSPIDVEFNRLPPPTLQPLQSPENEAAIEVRWSQVQGAVQYELQQAVDDTFQQVERHIISVPDQNFTLRADRVKERIYLRVQAIGSDGGVSEWSMVEVINMDNSK